MDQRRVHDVAVADHPADVGSSPEHLARGDAIEVLHRPFERDHVAAVVAHDALRPPGRARCVENVERIGRGKRHAVRLLRVLEAVVAQRLPVMVAARDETCLPLLALQDDASRGLVPRERDRLVEHRLVGNHPAGLEAAARREDQLRLGVVDPGGKLAGRKANKERKAFMKSLDGVVITRRRLLQDTVYAIAGAAFSSVPATARQRRSVSTTTRIKVW